jgi:hypothetical protein
MTWAIVTAHYIALLAAAACCCAYTIQIGSNHVPNIQKGKVNYHL